LRNLKKKRGKGALSLEEKENNEEKKETTIGKKPTIIRRHVPP
jgi:hypothetical protein